jgi:hypothetical protein
MIVELIRHEENNEHGTFGVLKINKALFCFTLEPKDFENKKNVSSIPTGQYMCQDHHSHRFGDVYQVMNVPDRDMILFHPGNTDDDTKGCILLGQSLGRLGARRAVLNSGKTFKAFREIMGDEGFHLTITEIY